jgi:hypothetical protein
MSWYTIVIRERVPGTLRLQVPGLKDWTANNLEAFDKVDGADTKNVNYHTGRNRVRDERDLVAKWNASFGVTLESSYPFTIKTPLDRLDPSRTEDILFGEFMSYHPRIKVLPEHQAPALEYLGEENDAPDWIWPYTDDEGHKHYHQILGISEHKDVGKAWDQAAKDLEHWTEKVEAFETKEWMDDMQSLRRQYEDFRTWVTKRYGVTPPPAEPLRRGEHGFTEPQEALASARP